MKLATAARHLRLVAEACADAADWTEEEPYVLDAYAFRRGARVRRA